jgi:hypothetical protein
MMAPFVSHPSHSCAVVTVALLALGCGRGTPAQPAQPTTGAIAGVVTDSSTGDPLSFARIEATEWSTRRAVPDSATTQADGAYRLDALAEGTYLIEVQYADHRVRFFTVPVHLGQTTTLDVPIDASGLTSSASYDYIDMLRNPIATAAPVGPARERAPARSGGIRGSVRDQATQQFLPGAVVAATTPGLRDAQLAIADDDGTYLLRSLPPGTYTLSVYYHLIERGNIEVRRTGVGVNVGEMTVIDLLLDAQIEQ